MARHRRRRQQNVLARPGGASNQCGLVAYQDRANAEAGARAQAAYHGPRPRPYLCKTEYGGCGLHHVGFLPTLVVAGVCTATEWYETYDGGPPLRNIIPPLCEYLINRIPGADLPAISRRVDPVTDQDFWTLTIKTSAGEYTARDHDSPTEAAITVINQYSTAAGTAQLEGTTT
jgi:hypothetical protein